jgi:hypothetical protein
MNVPIGKTAKFVLILARPLRGDAGDNGHVFGDEVVVSQCHLQAHVRTGHKVIGDNKGVGVLVRQGVEAAPQLDNFLSLGPIAQLSLYLMARHISCQKQRRLKEGLILNDI